MYIETEYEKLSAAIRYIIDAEESDYLSESDIECLRLTPVKDLPKILMASEIRHLEKYGRPITGNLYLGAKKMTAYNRALVARIQALPNIDEILDFLEGV